MFLLVQNPISAIFLGRHKPLDLTLFSKNDCSCSSIKECEIEIEFLLLLLAQNLISTIFWGRPKPLDLENWANDNE